MKNKGSPDGRHRCYPHRRRRSMLLSWFAHPSHKLGVDCSEVNHGATYCTIRALVMMGRVKRVKAGIYRLPDALESFLD